MILLIFVMIFTAPGCHKETEQEKVKKVITDIQVAAEEKDAKKVTNHLSKSYGDPQGFNYETVQKMLQGYFLIHPKISAYITNLDISVDKVSASVIFHAVLTSGKKTGSVTDIVPQSLGRYDFNVLLKEEPDGWKVTSATWAQAGTD